MEFFKTLAETGVNDVIVQFAKEENGQITVIVSPKNIIRNNPLLQIKPIVLTGTPEEVDTKFNDTVVKALAVAQKLHDILEASKPITAPKPNVSLTPKNKKSVVKTEPKIESVSVGEETVNIVTQPEPIKLESEELAINTAVLSNVETVGPEEVKSTKETWLEGQEKVVAEKTKAAIEKLHIQTSPVTNEQLADVVTKTLAEETKIIPLKTSVVNNEKHLKEFVTTLKTDADWYANEAEIERLYANCSQAELDKPYPKKVRLDLDIKLRKKAVIQAARDKIMGTVPETLIPNPVEEQIKEGIENGTYIEAVPETAKTYAEILSDIDKQQSEPVVIPPPPPSLKYSFPVPFDQQEDDEEPDYYNIEEEDAGF